MTYDFNYNKLAFDEQVEFFKFLESKLGLNDINSLGVCIFNCSSEHYDFLNKELEKYIKTGKLNNYLKERLQKMPNDTSVDIKKFWNYYWSVAGNIGIEVPYCFSDEAMIALETPQQGYPDKSYVYENSLVEFVKPYDNDDGSTIFSYTDSNRFL